MAGSRLVSVFFAVLALLATPALAAAAPVGPKAPPPPPPPSGPIRLGFCAGDDWEPEEANQGSTVYVVITHYPQTNSCDPAAAAPNTIDIQVSTDGGRTFGAPHPVFTGSINGVSYPAQADPVVAVDAAGAVYVSFLGYGNSGGHTDVVAAKSTDHGATFTAVKVNAKDCKNCDHEKIAVTGQGIYIAYSQAGYHFISRSGDSGQTWTQSMVLSFSNVAFAESMVVDSAGNVYTAWGDCLSSNCTGTPAAVYQVSKTLAGTLTTSFVQVAQGDQGPDCPFSSCGFSYFGPQDDLAIDAAGNLYLVWQDGQVNTSRKSPPIVNLSKSTDGGQTWSFVGRVDDQGASSAYAVFPTITAGSAGSIWVAWMDDRAGSPINHVNGWNLWLRSSTNGGSSFGADQKMNALDPLQPQEQPNGFIFPYGDYFGLELNACGAPHLTWGEGQSWVGPGHIEYRTLC
jgi:BNR repeat-like domain